ncbi:MAG: hypothetical protein DRR06_03150 [Gammaproteobacteria bacterium]|nr:MAG: hypothetical protein DRR06_03150 [Gammaproteobacteria bacterium]
MPQNLLAIEQVRFGSLSIPGWAVQPVWDFSQQYLSQFEEYQQLINAVQNIQITPEQLVLTYTADWEAIEQLKDRGLTLLVSDAERSRIQLYRRHLVESINDLSKQNGTNDQHGRQASLSRLLQEMFQFALKRSSLSDQASAIDENKALLFVLAMHLGGRNIDGILGKPAVEQAVLLKNGPKFTLRKRVDLAQHFSISAFIAAAAGDGLAQATGLFKEVSDSKGGSGFSFADLAADQAGVEFGTMAVASETSAHSLQVHMARITNEDDYMPKLSSLPEGLQEATFKRQYGTTEDARYTRMQNELDRRIDNCRLYRDKG